MRLTNPAWQVVNVGRTHWIKDIWATANGPIYAR